MKRELKLVAIATAAAILAGCASGGGTSHSGNSGLDELALGIGCVFAFGLSPKCHKQSSSSSSTSSASRSSTSSTASTNSSSSIPSFWSGASSQSAPVTSRPTSFESWSTYPRDTNGKAPGVETYVSYQGRISSVYVRPGDTQWADSGLNDFKYDAQGNLVVFNSLVTNPIAPVPNLSDIGHPGIDVGLAPILSSYPQSPFTSVAGSAVGVIGNPYALGWDYQSFGAWNYQMTDGVGGSLMAQSFGAVTPASAVPLSGTATFAGKLAGLYISPAGEGSIAASNVTVNADFSARSLSFASSNTVTTRDLAIATPAPGLDLSGTLSYSAGSGRFGGTLTSAGGTMSGESSGQFYGPKADELGGVFVVKSASTVETFTGAYGAKR